MSVIDDLATYGLSVVKLLGEGAFGKVFHCTTEDGKHLAVKIASSPHARAAATCESVFMTALPAHPNVMPISFFHSTSDNDLLAMPLATGGDTLQLMQERNGVALPETDIRTLFTQLVDAIEHLHNNGIVHRDIKCENILLTGTSRRTVLLADFGFAARYVKGKNALSESYGSLYYSSPEIVEQVAYEGPEVDVWSMGVVLYSWASGRLPFGGTKEEIAARIKSGSFMMQTSFSQQLRDLISRMLDVNPASRATIADIRKHEWFTASTVKAGMPANTSEGNITRWFAAQEHRRRNSDITLKKPSSLSKIVNIPFGRK